MLSRYIPVVLFAGLALAGCNQPTPEARGWLQSAGADASAGNNAAAIEKATKFINAYGGSEESAEAFYIRGLAHYKSGQTPAAKADFDAGLKLARRKDLIALIRMELGNLAYDAGDIALAESNYRTVTVLLPPKQPPADQAAYRLARVLQRRGQWADADLYFDRVMYLFPESELARHAATQVRATHWSVQAGAYTDAAQAEGLAGQLRQAGLSARVDKDMRDDKLLYLVRVGNYQTVEAGQADLDKARRLRADAYLTAAR